MKRAMPGLVFLFFLPVFALAQQAKDSWDNLKQLRPAQKIEIVDTKMKSLKGGFISFTDEAIVLREGKAGQSVARADVMRVSVRDTSHRTRNMLIGAAVGVGAGLAIAIPAIGICSNEGNCGTTETAGAVAVVGGLGAAGVGLGATPGSRTIYRVKK